MCSRYLPVWTQSPWERDTRTRRTETLPSAAGGPPATKESETPWTARSPKICIRQQFSPARALTTCACAEFDSRRKLINGSGRPTFNTMIGLFFGMDARFLLVICLLCVLEVDCETYPHLSFGNNIPKSNHSYVDLGMVGPSHRDSVQCRSDLSDNHNGQWYFPNGDPLSEDGDIYQFVASTRVDLRRRNDTNSPTGIYHCEIAVSGNADGARVYVGLYINGGKYLTEVIKGQFTIIIGGSISISGDIMFNPDQRTLTCISTGGPATAVSWTRDSTTVITEGTETVLNDRMTAQYTHTLTVTVSGTYTCNVSNNKPSWASSSITLGNLHSQLVMLMLKLVSVGPPPPTGVTAVRSGPTSIRVTWAPPDPLDGITGYRIDYIQGGASDSETVDVGNIESHTLTGLTNGKTYTISTVTKSMYLVSKSVATMAVPLGKQDFPY